MRLCCQLAGHHTSCWPVLQCVTVCYSVCGSAVDSCVLVCPYPLVFLLFWIHLASSVLLRFTSLFQSCPRLFYSFPVLFGVFLSSFVLFHHHRLFLSCPLPSRSALMCSPQFVLFCLLPRLTVFLLVCLRVPFSFVIFCSVHISFVPSQPRSCPHVLFYYLLYLHLLLPCPLQFCLLLFSL